MSRFLFLFCTLLFSCAYTNEEERGSYAETQFLPVSVSQQKMLSGKNDAPVTLDGAQQRILDEILARSIIEKTLAKFERAPYTLEEIRSSLEGHITEGVAVLRFYSDNKNFSVQFLQQLLSTFEQEKKRVTGRETKKKISAVEKQLDEYGLLRERLEDSLITLKNQYSLPEMAQYLQEGNMVDSAVSAAFSSVSVKLGKTLEHYARLEQQKDNLVTELETRTLVFYLVRRPHYVTKKTGNKPNAPG